MTSTHGAAPLTDGDDAASVLAAARSQKAAEDDAARRVMQAAARWAAMHSTDSVVGPVDDWHESCLPLGGQGCAEVAEFAVLEVAAALGRSTGSGRRYLSQAVEARYRLDRCWARLVAGRLQAWRLAFIAERTICLPPGRRRVRRRPRRTGRPHHRPRPAGTADHRGQGPVRPRLDRGRPPGRRRPPALRHPPRPDRYRRHPPRRRRARPRRRPRRRRREVVLHVHLSHAAVESGHALARVREAPGPLTVEQVRLWCGNPETHVTIKPVIDLAEHIHVGAHEASDRLKDQTQLRDLTCVFPHCQRPAHRCDDEHRVPHADDGPTCSCNLAPVCRTHHRAKTTGGWTYVTIQPGIYLWRSPMGNQFLRDHTGTIDVTPDDERRRLAHTFLCHLDTSSPGDPGEPEP